MQENSFSQQLNMKKILIAISLFMTQLAAGQEDSVVLKDLIRKLEVALINKDQVVLTGLLHKNTSYGHSNGWVQNKSDVMADFKSGKLIYNQINSSETRILDISKSRATVKMNTAADGMINGNSFNLNMHVMQVWIKTKKGWQLYVRQSAKI